jgi:hypothetical protein
MPKPESITESFLDQLKGKEVLLFLSATTYRQKYCTLPYDYVILNNEHFATRGEGSDKIFLYGKKVIVMPFHNYTAIKLLRERQIKITAFVGIDSYQHHSGESFNSVSFFSKLGPILSPVAHYITDNIYQLRHDGMHEAGFLNANYEVFDEVDRKFIKQDLSDYFVDFFGDLFDVTCLVISKIVERKTEVKLKGRTYSKIYGNLFDHTEKYPCLIIDGLTDIEIELLISLNQEQQYLSLSEALNLPFVRILALAQKQKWDSIGFSIRLDTHMQTIVDACTAWESVYPSKLDFYSINRKL